MGKNLSGYLSVLFVGLVLGLLISTAYFKGKSTSPIAMVDPVVAELKGESINASQAFKDNKRRIFELEEGLFKIKRQSLEDYLENRLLAEESKKTNLPVDRLILSKVGTEIGPISDQEVDSFLVEKGIPAQTAEKKADVREYLKYRKAMENRQSYLTQLKREAGLKVYLNAPASPRVQVDTAGYPSWGDSAAPITLVEFADYECPFCQRASATLNRLMEAYGPKVLQVVFRDLPSDAHSRAIPAALAAHCAQDQGKFWPFHQALYEHQTLLQDVDLKGYATKIGLEPVAFTQCFESKKFLSTIEKSKREAEALAFDSTPTFVVNGIVMTGAQPFEVMKEKIDALLSDLKGTASLL